MWIHVSTFAGFERKKEKKKLQPLIWNQDCEGDSSFRIKQNLIRSKLKLILMEKHFPALHLKGGLKLIARYLISI